MKLKNWENLESIAEKINIKIDPNKPRESRLAVALAYDEKGEFHKALEAITGKSIHEYEPYELKILTFQRERDGPEDFYKVFPIVDNY